MKILILRLGSLGDIIHTLPLVNLIKQKFPQAEIHWLVKNNWAEILENHVNIKQIHKLPNSVWNYTKIIKTLKQENFDLILEMQTLMKTSILAYLIGEKQIIGLEQAREKLAKYLWTEKIQTIPILSDELHIIERNCQVLQSKVFGNLSSLEIKTFLEKTPDLFQMPKTEIIPKTTNKPIIALAPETRWESKNWSLNNWGKLIQKLSLQNKYQVYILGSHDLQKHFKESTKNNNNIITNLGGKTSLSDLKNLIPQVKLLIGGDSGLIHLASAYNIQTLGLYGPTSPNRTKPWNGKTIYLNLNCSPCHKRKCNLTGNNYQSCLENITVEEVFDFI